MKNEIMLEKLKNAISSTEDVKRAVILKGLKERGVFETLERLQEEAYNTNEYFIDEDFGYIPVCSISDLGVTDEEVEVLEDELFDMAMSVFDGGIYLNDGIFAFISHEEGVFGLSFDKPDEISSELRLIKRQTANSLFMANQSKYHII